MFHSIASAAPFCGRGKTQVADWSHQLPLLIIGRCQSRLLKLLDISILMFFLTMLLIYVLTRSCQCFFRSPHTLNRLEVSFLVENTNEHREHHHKLEMKSVLLCNAMKKKKNCFLMSWAVYWVHEDYTACNDNWLHMAAPSSLQTRKVTFLYPLICLF